MGNVVFFGVPYRKVQRLITANIPWLVGNFPINVSLVLRLLLMTSKGDDKEDALTKVGAVSDRALLALYQRLVATDGAQWLVVNHFQQNST